MIVETKNGKLKGTTEENGIFVFKGINYAKAPINELRFKPPEPINPWEGVKDATEFGPIAPQPPPFIPNPLLDALKKNEDNCLSINIWTPAIDRNKRPVMFWIHGGALETGNGAIYNGQFLSERGNIVVVTINYRLGALGFLYVPGKTANVGLLDQSLALKWVKENIESFGGDPENITIFGESAGALSVSCLMTMPVAKGLFKRGICESNVVTLFGHNPKDGISFNKMLFSTVGVEYGDLDAIRKIPTKELVGAFYTNKLKLTFAEYYPPYIDGEVLPVHPYEAVKNGAAKNFQIIAGTNEDEYKLFTALDPNAKNFDQTKLNNQLNLILTKLGLNEIRKKELIQKYEEVLGKMNTTSALSFLEEFQNDYIFRIPLMRYIDEQSFHQKDIYHYMFNWKSPAFGGALGACHALEIPFVWGSMIDVEMGFFPKRDEETDVLSKKIMDCWINFAKTGDPNHNNIPNWPKYDINRRSTMIFDKDLVVIDDPKGETRKIWNDI